MKEKKEIPDNISDATPDWIYPVFQSLTEAIITVDKSGAIRFMNPSAEKLTGWSKHDAIGISLKEVFNMLNAKSIKKVENTVKKVCRNAVSKTLVKNTLLISKSGKEICIEGTCSPVRSGKGDLACVMLVFQEKTAERKEQRAEEETKKCGEELEALRESEKKYHNLVERSEDGIIIIQDGKVLFANQGIAKMWGGTVAEILGTPFTDYVHPGELASVVDRYQRRMKGEEVPPIYETSLRRKDGSKAFAELNAGIITYKGKPADLVIVRDLTERKQAEEEIRIRNRELAELNKSARQLTQSLNLETVAQNIVRTCVQTFGVKLAWLLRAEPDGSTNTIIHFPDSIRYPEQVAIRWDDTPLGRGTTGRCIRSGKPVAFSDLGKAPDYIPWREAALKEGFVTNAAFPLVKGEKTFGCLNLYSDRPGFFGPRRTEYLQTFAHQAAIALENANLFEAVQHNLSEQTLMAEVLKKSEAKYRSLFENMAQGAFYQRADGVVVDANPAVLEMFGLTRDEFLGKTSLDPRWKVIHEDGTDCPGEQHPSMEALRTGKPVRGAVAGVFNPRKEEYVWMTINAIPQFREGEDKPDQVFVTLHDITQRIRAEEAQRDSQRMLLTVLDSIPSGVFWKDRDSIYRGANRTWLEDAGLKSSEEVVGKSDYDLPWEEEQADSFREHDKSVMESGIPEYNIIEPYLRADGTHAWARTNKVPLQDMEGNVIGILGTSEDVTERKRAEEALLESEERHRSLFETMAQGVVYQNREGQIISANPAAERMLGLSLDQMLGRTSLDPRWHAIHEDRTPYPGETHPSMVALRTGKEVKNAIMGVFNPQANEYRWINIHAVPQFKPGEKKAIQVFSTFDDFSDRKKAEEMLHRSLKETARAQSVVLALSQAAQAVQKARTTRDTFQTMGNEIKKLELHSVLLMLSDDGKYLEATHMTFAPKVLRTAERLTGISARGYRFHLKPGSFFVRLLNEGDPVFSDSGTGQIAEALPSMVRALAGRLAGLLGVDKTIYAPIKIKGVIKSMLAVMGKDLREDDIPAVSTFANQAALAIESAEMMSALQEELRQRRQIEMDLAKSENELRSLAAHLQSVREQERIMIAREIHDEIGQRLTALNMDLAWLGRKLPKDDKNLAQKREGMVAQVSALMEILKDLSSRLRPGFLEELGLVDAMEMYAEEFEGSTGISCKMTVRAEDIKLDWERSVALFRIFQESLTNAARHSGASDIKIWLEKKGKDVVLFIKDNGKGISRKRLTDPNSYGIIGMKERVEYFGGAILIQGARGKGTALTVVIPSIRPGEEG